MNCKLFLFLMMGFMMITSNGFTQDPDFHIYLSFGQSNMEGFPGIVDQDRTGVDDRFQMLAAVDFPDMDREKGEWYTAVPPLSRPGAGIGPSDYFGRTMVANLPENIRVGIVNVSVAGCRIELFDKDNYQEYAANAPGWMSNIIEQYGGNPYQHLVDMAKLAQQEGVIKGILLHQGESNTGDEDWPAKVHAIYNNLLNDLNLDADEVPLLAGETVHADQGGVTASMNEIIAELPEEIPTAHVISSAGAEDRQDNLHFSPLGYRVLGARYAVQMLSLMGIDIDEPDFSEKQ